MDKKPANLQEWLRNGVEDSSQSETITFCELLLDMAAQMEQEGEDQEEIRQHMLAMAGEFIEVAQAFKNEYDYESHAVAKLIDAGDFHNARARLNDLIRLRGENDPDVIRYGTLIKFLVSGTCTCCEDSDCSCRDCPVHGVAARLGEAQPAPRPDKP